MDEVIRQADFFGLITGSQVEAEISTEAIFDPANGLLTIDGFADLRVFADSPGVINAKCVVAVLCRPVFWKRELVDFEFCNRSSNDPYARSIRWRWEGDFTV